MRTLVNVNGRTVDAEQAVISVFDHGFLYGEGIYEVLRTYNGEPFLFDRHMSRLRASASMLALDVPISDQEIDGRFREVMNAAGLGAEGREAYLRLLVTRGIGELTYDPAACPTPSIVVIVKPLPAVPAEAYEEGVAVAMVDIVRNHPGSVNPLIKSNNLLNNVLAMHEAAKRGAFEGVMRNYRGELAECTTANLFVVKNGLVLTPPIGAGLLAGITRAFILEVGGQLGIPMREETLRDADLLGADEAFLTSTTREVVPIVRVDRRPIADGRPGPITRMLLSAYRTRAQDLTASAAERTLRA
jgi:branched-chain amino acid aminotransferase